MKVKPKKVFDQKVTYDPKLDDVQKRVKTTVKDHKFNEMVNKIGEQKLKTLLKG